MMKWLAAGGVVIVGFLVFLVLQLNKDSEIPTAEASVKGAATTPEAKAGAPARSAAIPVATPTPVDDGKPKKLDPQSDAFFYQFDEIVPKKLTMAAAECYTGGISRKHRNQHLKLSYDMVIKDGVVSVANMKMLPDSNLNDAEMEQCMMKKVAAVTWKNESLPDGVWADQLKISPERGMKKYTKENMEYEGDGPIGKAVMKSPNDPGLSSDSASKTDFDRTEQQRIEAGGAP